MQITCPKCGAMLESESAEPGTKLQCSQCQSMLAIPEIPLEEGSVFGDFRIEKVLGKGGMGLVYRAHQLSLDRPAALKILRSNLAKNKEYVEQFIREARSAARINHPHIVQAYAVGENDGKYFFAMEFVDGESMKSYLKREKIVPPELAATIARDIASALDCAWTSQKLVHQDIKPDNIMLTGDGSAKLADLGLAKFGGDAAKSSGDDDEVFGTPQYINPEQLTGEPTTVKSDIYSLGATLYHFLTGEFPFTGTTVEEMTRKHLDEPPPDPSAVNPSVPEALGKIVLAMMAKSPDDRPDGAELVKMLADYLAGGATEQKLADHNRIMEKKTIMPENNSQPKISIKPKLQPANENAPRPAISIRRPESAPVPPPSVPEVKPEGEISDGGDASGNVRANGSNAAKVNPPKHGRKLSTASMRAPDTGNTAPPVVKNLGKELGAKKKKKFRIPVWVRVILIVLIFGGAFYYAWVSGLLPENAKENATIYYTKTRDTVLTYWDKYFGKKDADDGEKKEGEKKEEKTEAAAPENSYSSSSSSQSSASESSSDASSPDSGAAEAGPAKPEKVVDRARVRDFVDRCKTLQKDIPRLFGASLKARSAKIMDLDTRLSYIERDLYSDPESEETSALQSLKDAISAAQKEYETCRKVADALKDPAKYLDKPIEFNRELLKVVSISGGKVTTESILHKKEVVLSMDNAKVRNLIHSRLSKALGVKNIEFYIRLDKGEFDSIGNYAPKGGFWAKSLDGVVKAAQ